MKANKGELDRSTCDRRRRPLIAVGFDWSRHLQRGIGASGEEHLDDGRMVGVRGHHQQGELLPLAAIETRALHGLLHRIEHAACGGWQASMDGRRISSVAVAWQVRAIAVEVGGRGCIGVAKAP